MDARERLRRYLEQRREMGELDLVLDTMSVDAVLDLVGGKASSAAARSGEPASSARTAAPQNAKDASMRDGAGARKPQIQPGAEAPSTDDWREALRAAERVPETPQRAAPSRAVAAANHTDVTSSDGTPVPPAELPPGITVGKPALPGGDDIARLPTLDAIAEMVRKCTRCPLHLTAKHGVPGEGSPNARFVCVGEAPGATEDETGRPFVGAAGQLLTKILAAIDLPREDVFICNVIKHRPPGNRNPLPNEIAACSPYLVRQLELIKPGVILALGTFAAQTLLETKESIGKLRGRIHRYHGIPLVVTYHPAALLRNPSWKRPTWDDVQLARRILDSSALPGA
jgi:DNA polymerase